jgi:hypothetical protein
MTGKKIFRRICILSGFIPFILLFQNCEKKLNSLAPQETYESSLNPEYPKPGKKLALPSISHYKGKDLFFLNRWKSQLSHWHAYLFTTDTKDWGGRLGWGASYAMESLLDIYEKSPQQEFIDLFIQYADSAFSKRDSVLRQAQGECLYTNVTAGAPIWLSFLPANFEVNESLRKANCWSNSVVHTGMILRSVARFIRLMENSKMELPIEVLRKVQVYEAYIKLALDYHELTERSVYIYTYAADQQVYAYSKYCNNCNDSETHSARSGTMDPMNILAVLGSVYVELSYRSTFYKSRAIYFSRTIKDLLRKANGPLGAWAYWPAYMINDVDDASHGALVADFVYRSAKMNLDILNTADVQKIANMFLNLTVVLVNGKQQIATDLDGQVYSNRDGTPIYQNASCGMWMNLASVNSQVTEVCKNICEWDQETYTCARDTHAYKAAEAQIYRRQ